MKISILGVEKSSHYFELSKEYDLELYDKKRDMRTFKFDTPVITHAPCAQWSRLKRFAKEDPGEMYLSFFCLSAVLQCSGIFEHPSGSSFFKVAGIQPQHSIDQHWFNFPARKKTYLFTNKIRLIATPLNFNSYSSKVEKMSYRKRSLTTLEFNRWLIESVLKSGL